MINSLNWHIAVDTFKQLLAVIVTRFGHQPAPGTETVGPAAGATLARHAVWANGGCTGRRGSFAIGVRRVALTRGKHSHDQLIHRASENRPVGRTFAGLTH
ncbi:hypothetical protein [Streptomyces sp. NPDC047028]|uniref:hypothetical protein n=1 Tax=Streptomyces sp. NPDC047028 TaxID=3155793 RepID=UPI0033CA1092